MDTRGGRKKRTNTDVVFDALQCRNHLKILLNITGITQLFFFLTNTPKAVLAVHPRYVRIHEKEQKIVSDGKQKQLAEDGPSTG